MHSAAPNHIILLQQGRRKYSYYTIKALREEIRGSSCVRVKQEDSGTGLKLKMQTQNINSNVSCKCFLLNKSNYRQDVSYLFAIHIQFKADWESHQQLTWLLFPVCLKRCSLHYISFSWLTISAKTIKNRLRTTRKVQIYSLQARSYHSKCWWISYKTYINSTSASFDCFSFQQ